jgi:hypothetical protein
VGSIGNDLKQALATNRTAGSGTEDLQRLEAGYTFAAGSSLLMALPIPKLGLGKAINPFGLQGGYGIFGKQGLRLGNYIVESMYANPSGGVGAGTIFSLKQMKSGGALFRWDYGLLHSTGRMGFHSTIRFYWKGVKYGSTAQRTWYPSTLQAPFFKQIPK